MCVCMYEFFLVREMSSVPASARLIGSGTVPCPRKRSSVAG